MKTPRSRLLCLILLAIPCAPSPAAAPADRPDILLILVDDLGWGDLSMQGAEDLQSPHIDALAESGMRFERFYANCPVCSPTRASVLTGRYPELVGVPGVIRTHADNNWGYLAPDAVLLPRLLGQAGYHTAIVGKWHLGLEKPRTPLDRGFDHFAGFLGDMMDDYYNHRRHGINYMRRGREEVDPEGHATDLFSDWAVEYIRERAATSRPFFLYLAYNAPHTPIQPPEEWLRRVQEREEGILAKRARLVALIEHLDDGIGRVLDALEESGRRDRALVIFTSDNGGQLGVGANNGSLRGGKGGMYEGGIRVPLCASWPGRIARDSRSERIALTMDLFPTICEAAGVKVEHAVDGVSILPVLLGKDAPPVDRDLFWIRREGGNRYLGDTIRALRRGPWKLIQNSPTGPLELYNLDEDPLEERDVAESRRDVRNGLLEAWRRQVQRGGAVPWQPPRP